MKTLTEFSTMMLRRGAGNVPAMMEQMAEILGSVRLWLGGVVSPQRNYALIAALLARVVRCAVAGALLVAVDDLAAYVRPPNGACRTPEPRAGR